MVEEKKEWEEDHRQREEKHEEGMMMFGCLWAR